PARAAPPFVLDMSATVVATGRIKAAARAGEPVPAGWLRKPCGGATTDPQEYVAGDAEVAWLGGELATGGAKGYGLAVAVDLLCGALTGSGFGPRGAALADRGVPGFGGADELIKAGGVDGAVVTVPNDVHAPVCRRLLAAGVAVCCEKPLTTSSADARELVELARSTGTTLFTAFHRRYN